MEGGGKGGGGEDWGHGFGGGGGGGWGGEKVSLGCLRGGHVVVVREQRAEVRLHAALQHPPLELVSSLHHGDESPGAVLLRDAHDHACDGEVVLL